MRYQHTQRSVWTAGLAGAASVMAAVVLIGGSFVWFACFAALSAVLAVASRLTVRVDDERVSATFGWGWPRRSIPLAAVTMTSPARVRWYHGWGIRWVSGGWMYNVSGFHAVQLRLDSGRVFWIGTDEPDALQEALTAAITDRA